MKKENVFDTIDKLRERQFLDIDDLVLDRMCNYLETNIDKFIECYEGE